jgi:hypothetical protein
VREKETNRKVKTVVVFRYKRDGHIESLPLAVLGFGRSLAFPPQTTLDVLRYGWNESEYPFLRRARYLSRHMILPRITLLQKKVR